MAVQGSTEFDLAPFRAADIKCFSFFRFHFSFLHTLVTRHPGRQQGVCIFVVLPPVNIFLSFFLSFFLSRVARRLLIRSWGSRGVCLFVFFS